MVLICGHLGGPKRFSFPRLVFSRYMCAWKRGRQGKLEQELTNASRGGLKGKLEGNGRKPSTLCTSLLGKTGLPAVCQCTKFACIHVLVFCWRWNVSLNSRTLHCPCHLVKDFLLASYEFESQLLEGARLPPSHWHKYFHSLLYLLCCAVSWFQGGAQSPPRSVEGAPQSVAPPAGVGHLAGRLQTKEKPIEFG